MVKRRFAILGCLKQRIPLCDAIVQRLLELLAEILPGGRIPNGFFSSIVRLVE